VSVISPRRATLVALAALALGLAACTQPRPGPTAAEIFEGSVLRQGNAFIVAVGDTVNRTLNAMPEARGFPDALRRGQVLSGDRIRVGDTITITIFENVPEGLLTSAETRGARLERVQVDSEGFIFVPFAGRIRALGETPEGLRATIARQLDEQTPDPQVYISREVGDGATVSVVGRVGSQGVYPIERSTARLTAMIARAGGVSVPTQSAMITVSRGAHTARVSLDDLIRHPELDLALRGGDRILVEEDQRRFSVLGATGTQTLLSFESPTLSAIEALARVGGLDPARADPTGVFVFRSEPEAVARRLLGRNDLLGDQRMVYVIDLTSPLGMFHARDFQIRDGDTIYVTEASAVAWNRQIATISGALGATGAAATIARRIDGTTD
jgi:polysaccharide export outer membrane protein